MRAVRLSRMLGEPVPLAGLDAQERAPEYSCAHGCRGIRVGPAAFAEGDLPAFEVAEEFFPFLVGRGPVLLAGA